MWPAKSQASERQGLFESTAMCWVLEIRLRIAQEWLLFLILSLLRKHEGVKRQPRAFLGYLSPGVHRTSASLQGWEPVHLCPSESYFPVLFFWIGNKAAADTSALLVFLGGKGQDVRLDWALGESPMLMLPILDLLLLPAATNDSYGNAESGG